MKTRYKPMLMLLSATLIVGLSGCGSAPGLQLIEAATATESEIEKFGDQYEIEELVDAWETGMDAPCEREVVDVAASDAMRASCDHKTTLSTYPSSEGVEDQLQRENDRYMENGETAFRLVGPNWVMNVDDRFYEYYYEQLGGAIAILGENPE